MSLNLISRHRPATPCRRAAHDVPEAACNIVRASTVPLTVVDVSAPSQPLVVVNDAFSRLTGYEPTEVIGRNCRFLQHDQRNQPACEDIRMAIAMGTSVQARVVNFRKDGKRFVNLLYLHPLMSRDGVTRHYLGSQFADNESARNDQAKRLTADMRALLSYTDFVTTQSYRTISESVATVLRSSF
ncbi:MAG: PAS domain-containing protein [Pseudomonadota bacterium]